MDYKPYSIDKDCPLIDVDNWETYSGRGWRPLHNIKRDLIVQNEEYIKHLQEVYGHDSVTIGDAFNRGVGPESSRQFLGLYVRDVESRVGRFSIELDDWLNGVQSNA